jgi:hypothetical protein
LREAVAFTLCLVITLLATDILFTRPDLLKALF